MLSIITVYGEFVRWSDVLMYMLEEDLTTINVTRVEYVFDEVYGKGIYTLREVQEIVKGVNSDVEGVNYV